MIHLNFPSQFHHAAGEAVKEQGREYFTAVLTGNGSASNLRREKGLQICFVCFDLKSRPLSFEGISLYDASLGCDCTIF